MRDDQPTDELSCTELVELATDYLERALDAAERARVEAHLDECEGCATYFEQIEELLRLTGRLPADRLDPRAEHDLVAAFRSWRIQSSA